MSLKLIRRILEARMPESMDAMSWAFLIAAADRADDDGDGRAGAGQARALARVPGVQSPAEGGGAGSDDQRLGAGGQ